MPAIVRLSLGDLGKCLQLFEILPFYHPLSGYFQLVPSYMIMHMRSLYSSHPRPGLSYTVECARHEKLQTGSLVMIRFSETAPCPL